jgi:hypothetical protein
MYDPRQQFEVQQQVQNMYNANNDQAMQPFVDAQSGFDISKCPSWTPEDQRMLEGAGKREWKGITPDEQKCIDKFYGLKDAFEGRLKNTLEKKFIKPVAESQLKPPPGVIPFTSMCKDFLNGRSCAYRKKCWYAHDIKDLRPKEYALCFKVHPPFFLLLLLLFICYSKKKYCFKAL